MGEILSSTIYGMIRCRVTLTLARSRRIWSSLGGGADTDNHAPLVRRRRTGALIEYGPDPFYLGDTVSLFFH